MSGRSPAGGEEPGAEGAVCIRVEGRVQGVGFRHFVRSQALALGLRGYVRNRVDGSVEAIAEGPAAALEAFLTQVRRGPLHSHVSLCSESWLAASGRFQDFVIRH